MLTYEITLTCDGFGCDSGRGQEICVAPAGASSDPQQVFTLARAQGWGEVRGYWFCPDCVTFQAQCKHKILDPRKFCIKCGLPAEPFPLSGVTLTEPPK